MLNRIACHLIGPTLRWPIPQRLFARMVTDVQGQLGIGTGAIVNGSGEKAVVDRLVQVTAGLERPLCIFDVGANAGGYVDLLLKCLGERQTTIHCFEPSEATANRLGERHAQRPNVIINRCGLGRAAGECRLYSDGEGSGLASLTRRDLTHFDITFEQSETVSIRTLDDYCTTGGVTAIDLLKIDVEGHELDVLQGGARMFAERRISLVQFEFGGCNIDTRTFVREFWNFFTEAGMRSFSRIMPSGKLFRIDRYTEDLEQFRTTNFLVECVPPAA